MVSRRRTGAPIRPGSGPAAVGLAEPDRARRDMKKVLIVDDEQSIVIYLTTVLEDGGYERHSRPHHRRHLHRLHHPLVSQ